MSQVSNLCKLNEKSKSVYYIYFKHKHVSQLFHFLYHEVESYMYMERKYLAFKEAVKEYQSKHPSQPSLFSM